MITIIFNGNFIVLEVLVLLWAVSTAALVIAIRCLWSLREKIFITATFKEKLISLSKQGMWQDAFDYSKLITAR